MMADRMVTFGPVTASVQSFLFLACLLSSYAFSWIYYHFLLHSRWHRCKQLYLATMAQVFLVTIFSKTVILNTYLPIIFTYLVSKHYPHKRWMPMVVFCAVLGHLALVHLQRQFFESDLGEVDHSAPLMVLVIKLTTFAFDISDAYFAATVPKPKKLSRQKPFAKGHESPPPKPSEEELQREAQMVSLQRFPTALEFAGYAFLFPGFLSGPAIPFYDYRRFIEGSFFEGVDTRNGALAGRKRRALKQFLVSMAFMLIYALLKDTINLQHCLEPDHLAKPIWYRLLYLHLTNLVWRSRYYFVWLAAEGSYILIGLGFRRHIPGSHSHKVRWDRCENVNVWRFELAYNFKQIVGEWNVATNRWLYAYVYKRIADWQYPGRRPGFRANLATYVVSAIWHGFYPGYYIMFITSSLYTYLSRLTYTSLTWPLNQGWKKWLLYLPNAILFDYIIAPFELLTWTESVRFMQTWSYWGHVFIIVSLWILLMLPSQPAPAVILA